MSREVVLRTDRLVLTTWQADDVEDLLEVHSDPQTMRFVRHGHPETRDEVTALIGEYIADHERAGFTKWRVADREGRLVGRAGFGVHREGRELGYTIRRDLWRRGLATEVATALVTWHREHAATVRLWAFVSPGNPASARVLQKVGFERVGTVSEWARCACSIGCRIRQLRPSDGNRWGGMANAKRSGPWTICQELPW